MPTSVRSKVVLFRQDHTVRPSEAETVVEENFEGGGVGGELSGLEAAFSCAQAVGHNTTMAAGAAGVGRVR
ncbi:hypothetical protein LV79_005656 [Actinokineospora globicatena]|nr:hypothetical protein [Actinokineospora globicatena]GLW80204.1 hypothetical protein Aglo01_46850 [Actinokineospora globicatena]GLW87033.1 hypothetical protein Aglo02_46720 [Actinokineospora globicatena]